MHNIKALITLIAFMQVTFFPPALPAQEIYQYTNAAGRTVYTSRLPSGQKDETVNKNSDNTRQNTHQFCREKWGNDFSMVEHCMKSQRDAKMNLHRYPKEILQFCEDKWHDDYTMIEHCSRNQYAAKKRIGQ